MKKRTGILTLGTLLVGLAACGPSETEKQVASQPLTLDTPAETTAAATPTFDHTKVKFKGPGKLLSPAYGQWTLSAEPRYFNAETLYDLINGGSDVFVNYGFQEIVTADYRNEAQKQMTVNIEVYDMKTPLGAFGRVSLYLDNMNDPASAGKGLPEGIADYGINGDGDIVAWKGQYLVHLTILDEDPATTIEKIKKTADATLPGMLEKIFQSVEAAPALPEEVALFPTTGLVPRSWTWQHANTLGFESLPAGFTARYKGEDDCSWALFLTDAFATEEEAKAAMEAATKTAEPPLSIRLAGLRLIGAVNTGEKTRALEDHKEVLAQLEANLEATK